MNSTVYEYGNDSLCNRRYDVVWFECLRGKHGSHKGKAGRADLSAELI